MSFFDNIVQAETYNQLPYIEPGNFTFRIDQCLQIVSKQGKGEFLIVEFSIVDADTSAAALQTGGRCSLRIKLASPTGPKNAASFLLAALGSLRGRHVAKLEPADQAVCIGPDSKLVGKLVKAQAFLKPKKNTPGENYTHVNWFPVFDGES